MKHSKKSQKLYEKFVDVEDQGFLTDKQKRAERRRIKKQISKTERRENKFLDDDDYAY